MWMEHQKQPSCWSSGSNNSPKCSVWAQGIKPSKCPYRKLLVTLMLWYSVDIFILRNNLNSQSWNNSVCAILLLENKLICVFDRSAESLVLPPFRCDLSALWHRRETSEQRCCGLPDDCNICMKVWMNHRRSSRNVPGVSISDSQQNTSHRLSFCLLDRNGMGARFVPLYILFLCHHRHWIKYGGWYEASH